MKINTISVVVSLHLNSLGGSLFNFTDIYDLFFFFSEIYNKHL